MEDPREEKPEVFHNSFSQNYWLIKYVRSKIIYRVGGGEEKPCLYLDF